MNRRTRNIEAVVLITRMIDRARVGRPNLAPSAFTIATTLDKLARASAKVARLHLDELNSDHEKCPKCAADERGDRMKRCAACGGTGRISDEALKEWYLARDRAERRIEKMLRDLGFLPPSDTTGRPDLPTWEIDRDVRGGTVKLYVDQEDRKRGVVSVVFPLEGF
jgi:hypothetical protein